MSSEEVRRRLETEPDFVFLPRFGFSLKETVARYPDGAPDRVIAAALLVTEDDVEALYQSAILKLRESMGIEIGL